MKKNYQRKERKSNHKFEVVRGQELLVRVPLPMAEVWAEMQAQVEELTGQAGLQILRAILENEVTRRVGPPHRPNPRVEKSLRLCLAELRIRRFDTIAEASELSDHLRRALLLRLFGNRGAPFFVTNSLVQD